MQNSSDSNAEVLDGIRHVVTKGERIEQLASQYKLTVSEIVSHNKLKSLELQTGQVIYLPKKETEVKAPIEDTIIIKNVPPKSPNRKFKLACVFPFDLENAIEIDANGVEKVNTKSTPALEMLAGLKLGIDSLLSLGIDVELIVRDIPLELDKEKELINELAELHPDFVFAHLPEDRIDLFSKSCVRHDLRLMVFMSADNAFLNNGSNLFLYTPSVQTQIAQMTNYLSNQNRYSNIIVLYGEEEKERELALKFQSHLNSRLTKLNSDTVRISGPYTKSFEKLKTICSTSENNLIVVCSSREAFVTRLCNYLLEQESYRFQLAGLPTWAYFERIDNHKKDILQFTYFTPSYLDFESSRIKSIRKEMVEEYRYDLNFHSLSFFDLGFHFSQTFVLNPFDYTRMIKASPNADMDFIFDFRPVSEEGQSFENHGIKILKHENNHLFLQK
ncbi:MAG TPA: LysM peptidoglycan-binding domain-containing protein [Bacteroidia bacterium]|nr:LysM peptidoglycan-binding domain-containing protein [Bacteroidia bacterium]